MKVISVFLILFLLIATNSLFADTILMLDGETVTGKITAQNRTSITVKTPEKSILLLKKQLKRITYRKVEEETKPVSKQEPSKVEKRSAALPESGVAYKEDVPDLDRTVRKGKAYTGPIIDTHLHFFLGSENVKSESFPESLIEFITKNSIKKVYLLHAVNSGRKHPEKSSEIIARIRKLDGERAGAFCCGNYLTSWMDEASKKELNLTEMETLLKRVEKDLDSGEYTGIGEMAWQFFKKRPGQMEIHIKPDFIPFLRIADIAEKKNVWLVLHAEPGSISNMTVSQKEMFAGIELLYKRNPKLKLILAHTGLMSSENARLVLKKYPGIIMDIHTVVDHDNWGHLGPVTNESGQLYEDWALLFEEMPERFIVGIDAIPGLHLRLFKEYQNKIDVMRILLGSIDPLSAEKIAFKNAEKYFDKK